MLSNEIGEDGVLQPPLCFLQFLLFHLGLSSLLLDVVLVLSLPIPELLMLCLFLLQTCPNKSFKISISNGNLQIMLLLNTKQNINKVFFSWFNFVLQVLMYYIITNLRQIF
ncbi:hypothetical protein HanXRQr2_Chr01g0034121 [Helianthus annuus]|uniref:Uncharacterized protein n=1 Tax=Helianthus annuus TaxID=4232 RepID=A0A9K3P5D6_HELAN|nr:hypothetical protein HanXRQr2_Chr01g0034121 [Helianthus annuus]